MRENWDKARDYFDYEIWDTPIDGIVDSSPRSLRNYINTHVVSRDRNLDIILDVEIQDQVFEKGKLWQKTGE